MRTETPRNFYDAATASKAPKGEYASAREMIDVMPAIIMHNYGEAVRARSTAWSRSTRTTFDGADPTVSGSHEAPHSPPMRCSAIRIYPQI
jgi:hypothetical protein